MDSQMRWVHAEQFLDGDLRAYGDWFSPYLTLIRQFWLSLGWG